MYTTIEADIENGRIIGPESRKLPAMAHVLITLLPRETKKDPMTGSNVQPNMLSRFAGAWQGELLVREEQGDYEIRSELE